MPLQPGTIVDTYRVESQLGEGSMATVFLVSHTETGKRHALKLLKADAKGKTRMLLEGAAQSSIFHPNVVHVDAILHYEGLPALIMDYVEGPDLGTLCKADTLDIEARARLGAKILEGVKVAHDDGWIHRDLKPANILVERCEDGRLVPKVSDFGLVKLETQIATGLTSTGTMMGTPAFMAPEQIEDASCVTKSADVFSLGALLYFVMSGKRPFKGVNLMTLLANIHLGQYTPIEELVPDLPPHMVEAIKAAMRVKPEDRPTDAGALLERWTTVGGANTPAPVGAHGEDAPKKRSWWARLKEKTRR